MWYLAILPIVGLYYFRHRLIIELFKLRRLCRRTNFTDGGVVSIDDGIKINRVSLPRVSGHYDIHLYHIPDHDYSTPDVETDGCIPAGIFLLENIAMYSKRHTYYIPIKARYWQLTGLSVLIKLHGQERHCLFHLTSDTFVDVPQLIDQMTHRLAAETQLAETYD